MITIHHANFGWLHAPPLPPACCHCLIVRDRDQVILIDTGIGMHDIHDPLKRIGKVAIDAAGFQFRPETTALHQLEQLGLSANFVTDIVLTHGDPDHAGGLADFPNAKVHLSLEEQRAIKDGGPRYNRFQFEHKPHWVTYAKNDTEFLGLPARRVATAADVAISLISLPGHTFGHCGVGIESDGKSWLHVGDAYYLRAELSSEPHPIDGLATARADDDSKRRASLKLLQDLHKRYGNEVTMFGYHDATELPNEVPGFEPASST